MTYRLGLTGSIGMGKSTTAAMFRDLDHPVWDADDAVHRLYRPGGAAVALIFEKFPSAVQGDAIERSALKAELRKNPDGFALLEAIVHPLLAQDRQQFLAENHSALLVVFDIPLLFETGANRDMDGVAVVSTSADIQRQRVLARPGITPADFAMILDRQMPDAEKRQRADWVIPTDTLSGAREAVEQICKEIRDHA